MLSVTWASGSSIEVKSSACHPEWRVSLRPTQVMQVCRPVIPSGARNLLNHKSGSLVASFLGMTGSVYSAR